MTVIFGKTLREYGTVIWAPLLAVLVYFVVLFGVGFFLGASAASGSMSPDLIGMLSLPICFFGLFLVFATGVWTGWRTVKNISGSYLNALVAVLFVAFFDGILRFATIILKAMLELADKGATPDVFAPIAIGLAIGLGLMFSLFVAGAVIGVFVAEHVGRRKDAGRRKK